MSGSEKFRLLINGSILLHSVFEFLWRVRFQERTLIWDRASLLNGLLYNKELSNTQFGIRRLTWSYSFSSLYNWETWFVLEIIWASPEKHVSIAFVPKQTSRKVWGREHFISVLFSSDIDSSFGHCDVELMVATSLSSWIVCLWLSELWLSAVYNIK